MKEKLTDHPFSKKVGALLGKTSGHFPKNIKTFS